MTEEYVAESGKHEVDFDKIEEEIMQTFEKICKEPSSSAIVQLAAVVEGLFERTRRAEHYLHADPQEFAALNHQMEKLKQQIQDLQTELRTVKENHEMLFEMSEMEFKKQKNVIRKEYEAAVAENCRLAEEKEFLLGHIAELEATGRRNESAIRSYIVEMQNIGEELRNAKEDLCALRQANLDRTWPSPADESVSTEAEINSGASDKNGADLAVAENGGSSTSAAEKWMTNPETVLEIGLMDVSSSNTWNGDLSENDVIAPPIGESLAAELRTMFPGTVGDSFFPTPSKSPEPNSFSFESNSSSFEPLIRNTPGETSVPLSGIRTTATSSDFFRKKNRKVNWSISALFLVYGLFGLYFFLNWLCERLFGVGLLRFAKPQ